MMRMLANIGLAALRYGGIAQSDAHQGHGFSVMASTRTPTGATCTLTRSDAKPLAVINPTPGSMPIDKGMGAIDDHLQASRLS
ncbi:MAG: hypothetical protein IPI87_19065 [Betaproteobacteria bacterium]|nr:hypothetical protein [Betaproteobacteria bacterium]